MIFLCLADRSLPIKVYAVLYQIRCRLNQVIFLDPGAGYMVSIYFIYIIIWYFN